MHEFFTVQLFYKKVNLLVENDKTSQAPDSSESTKKDTKTTNKKQLENVNREEEMEKLFLMNHHRNSRKQLARAS